MLKLQKGSDTKILSKDSSLVEKLMAAGWTIFEEKKESEESKIIEEIKAIKKVK